MGPITVIIWREFSIPYCSPSLYKEAERGDPLKQTAGWLQKEMNTRCSGHRHSSEGLPESNLAHRSGFTFGAPFFVALA